MANRSPRITVSLAPKDYAVLVRLSTASGESMSSIVSGLVGAVSPSLDRVAELTEAANSALPEVVENLREVADEAGSVLEPVIRASQTEFDAALERLLQAAGGDSNPPACNTGGGLDENRDDFR